MIVYHGSTIVVDKPDVEHSTKTSPDDLEEWIDSVLKFRGSEEV